MTRENTLRQERRLYDKREGCMTRQKTYDKREGFMTREKTYDEREDFMSVSEGFLTYSFMRRQESFHKDSLSKKNLAQMMFYL